MARKACDAALRPSFRFVHELLQFPLNQNQTEHVRMLSSNMLLLTLILPIDATFSTVIRQKWIALSSSCVKLCVINPTHGSVVRHRDRSAWNGVDNRTNGRRHQNCGLEAKSLCR